MNKNIPLVIILIALVFLGWILYQSNALPFVNNNVSNAPAEQLASCYVGGCSSQICSDQPDVISTCEFREEYSCYQTAKCERQATGKCGWTETTELKMCLQTANQAL